MSLWLPDNSIRPSYASGFARSQADAANPGLWTGLQFLQDYRLGYTGTTQQSVVGPTGTLTNMDASNWSPEGLTFDGTNENLVFGDVLNLSGSVSLSCWVYPLALEGTKNIFGRCVTSYTAPYYQYALLLNSGILRLSYWDGASNRSVVQSAVTLIQDQWNHITGVVTPGAQALYVNGAISNTASNAAAVASSSVSTMELRACRYFSNYTNAILANAAIWSRVLNPSEIALLADDSFALVRQRPRYYSVASGEAPPATFSPWWARGINTHVGAC